MRSCLLPLLVVLVVLPLSACGDDDSPDAGDAGTDADAGDATPDARPPCTESFGYEPGDPTGHAEPLNAGVGEARAGRLAEGDWPDDPSGLSLIENGDFVLANDRIAIVIEDSATPSDLLDPFGGRMIGAATMVGGVPTAPADVAEVIIMLERFGVATESVSVINDGSDGNAAIVRAVGPIGEIPFFAPLGSAFLSTELGDLFGALDWVLEPGAEHVDLRFHVASPRNYDTPIRIPLYFLFQAQRMPEWHPSGVGFAPGPDPVDYVAFIDDDATSYAISNPAGPLPPFLSLSGASIFQPDLFVATACAETMVDFATFHIGGTGLDGLRASIARTEGTTLREVTGTVTFDDGSPGAGVRVHATDADGGHVTRTLTDETGAFTLNLPNEPIDLVGWVRGYALSAPVAVPADGTTASVTMPAVGWVHVTATDATAGEPLPVRVQVIPDGDLPNAPPSFGETPIVEGRLHVEFPTDGEVTLPVPPGSHMIYVSRGFEWELESAAIVVAADETVEVPVTLDQVVPTPNVLCGDFHIHTHRSFDTADPVLFKVASAVGDGIEIAVRSDHEWVGDFEPTITTLGVEDWTFGVSSLELTTFDWGHFGVFPIEADPTARNDGAIEWTGRVPQDAFDEAHDLMGPDGNAVVMVNHGRDFGGIMGEGAYFSRVDYDPTTGMVGRPDLYSEDFDLLEAFNETDFDTNFGEGGIVTDWFSFLNSGRRIYAVGSSDSHQVATKPIGYPRTCLTLGHDDAASLRAGGGAGLVRDTLMGGHAVVNGGAYIDIVGPGGEGPGDDVTGAGDRATISVMVRAPSFVELDRLRIFVDGAVTETIVLDETTRDAMDPTIRFSGDIDIPVAAGIMGSWAIVVADGVTSDLGPVYPDKIPFGVTNPVFFTR